jgi:hypothetical protein
VKAFELKANGKILDYRKAEKLDLDKVRDFFEEKYIIDKLWQENRHVLGILKRDGIKVFLKLATTPGIGIVTQSDFNWNRQFNDIVSRKTDFWVPQNIESGFYNDLFYMVVEYFDGKLFANRPKKGKVEQILKEDIEKIIELSEVIQNLDIDEISIEDENDYQKRFLEKTKSWYKEVPKEVIKKFKLANLLDIVTNGVKDLDKKTRHGDFAPWHLMRLNNKKIGLIDGERALKNGVEYYDICYLIQRVFSIMENPEFSKDIYKRLVKRGYGKKKLKTVLAARALGGFCDETLIIDKANYPRANKFKARVINLD